jgi:CrcB protein
MSFFKERAKSGGTGVTACPFLRRDNGRHGGLPLLIIYFFNAGIIDFAREGDLMLRILMIGVGGFIGTIFRYLISGYIQNLMKSFEFPYGTLVVNVVGCFVIGLLSELADAQGAFSSEIRSFLFIGILGGFTTFSTFGNETFHLLRDNQNILAAANVITHVLLGLGAVWIGRGLVHVIWR